MATPIGNAGDMSRRAIETLIQADVIACEDTRVSVKLLARYGIATRRIAYHEHNAERMRPQLLDRLARGGTVALISDAGTPLISDPGFKLVQAAIAAGIAVTTVPGPSAPIAALVLSGLPTDRFLFAGFLPARAAARQATLRELAAVPSSLVLFESAGRLAASLADMSATLGPRPAAVARELTKLYEEVRRGTLTSLAAHYAAAGAPKGEIVVVIGPPESAAASDDDVESQLRDALERLSLRDAVDAVAAATGRTRRDVYGRALALSGRGKAGRSR